MDTVVELMDVERLGDTLVLTAERDLREVEFEAIEEEQQEMLRRLAHDHSICNVVVDFRKTDSFGSTALKLLLRLWRVVRERGGRMALCNVAPYEQEILAVTRLGRLWPAYASRAEALEAVNG
jgi:anti-anti-sigma factor